MYAIAYSHPLFFFSLAIYEKKKKKKFKIKYNIIATIS